MYTSRGRKEEKRLSDGFVGGVFVWVGVGGGLVGCCWGLVFFGCFGGVGGVWVLFFVGGGVGGVWCFLFLGVFLLVFFGGGWCGGVWFLWGGCLVGGWFFFLWLVSV